MSNPGYCQMCGQVEQPLFPLHYNDERQESIRYSCARCAANALGDRATASAEPAGQLLADMREWLADNVWTNMEPEDFDTLSADTVRAAIRKYFDGQIAGFLAASMGRPAQ